MRREWDVWRHILDIENCRKAILKEACTRRCRRNGFSAELREHQDTWAAYVRERLGDGLRLGPFVEFDTVECGKVRHVQCYTPTDAMCIRAAVQIMEPLAYKRMTPRSVCPVKGRGGLYLAAFMRRLLKRLDNICRVWNMEHPKSRSPWKPWVQEFDQQKYYQSISYNVAHDATERVFGEPEVLAFLEACYGFRDGLPIGAPYSSMVANLVMAPLDWDIIHHAGVYGYARNLDNTATLTKSKSAAHDVRRLVEDWNAQHGLTAHEWSLYPAGHHAIEMGGWRVDGDKIIPSENVTKHLLRLMKRPVEDMCEKHMLALASLYGYILHGESVALKRLWREGRYYRIFKIISVSAREAETGFIIANETRKEQAK